VSVRTFQEKRSIDRAELMIKIRGIETTNGQPKPRWIHPHAFQVQGRQQNPPYDNLIKSIRSIGLKTEDIRKPLD
jgi:hypothetical protein